jgi:hypothetical protein
MLVDLDGRLLDPFSIYPTNEDEEVAVEGDTGEAVYRVTLFLARAVR